MPNLLSFLIISKIYKPSNPIQNSIIDFCQPKNTLLVQIQMFSQTLLSYLQLKPQQFPLQEVLLSLCKKSSFSSQSPEIDFLDFQEKVETIGHFHQKTCQEIVEFVDTHCTQYIQINGKFEALQQKIQKVQNIIKLVGLKIKDYSKIYYQDEAKIQDIISKYETSIMQKLIMVKCRQQTQFLSQFVLSFQPMIGKSMDNLIFKQRALLIRFCYKFKYLESLFNHHLLHQALPQYIRVYQMLVNLVDEVEFYISQQLSKLIKYKGIGQSQKDPKMVALNEIKLCYKYLNKLPEYYRNMEQNLIGRQLQIAQKNMLSHKINLIVGKNSQVVEQFFKCIFNSINHFPKCYPRRRLLQLIYNQLRKSEVKFLYTYTLPIFPISYNCYMKFIVLMGDDQNQLRAELTHNHNWDLKRWVDVRDKNIIDRCKKDWESARLEQCHIGNAKVGEQHKGRCPELNKWVDIIFKDNCKIDGVKSEIVKLAVKVVNKYAAFIQSTDGFQVQHLNKYIQTHENIQKLIKQKVTFFFQTSQPHQQQKINKLANSLSLSCKEILQRSIQRIVQKNTRLLSKSCCGSLQPHRSFIMKIIKSSKQLAQHGIINLFLTVFKPMSSYLQSNTDLSEKSNQWIQRCVKKEVMKFYDQSYVTEVYQHAKNNISVQQLNQVMEVVGKQRGILFVHVCEKDQNRLKNSQVQ